MPITYQVLKGHDLNYVRHFGRVSSSDITDTFSKYAADLDFRPMDDQLADLSEVTEIDIDFDQMRNVLRNVNTVYQPFPTPTRISFYAPSDLTFGMARMFQQLAEQQEGANAFVSRTQAEALACLDRPQTHFRELGIDKPPDQT